MSATPGPWRLDADPFIVVYGEGDSICDCAPGSPYTPMDAAKCNARLIVAAVNNYGPMLRSLESNARLWEVFANKLDRWARESREGGWSTHQVQENIAAANDCRRYAATIRSALANHEAA